MHCYVSHVNSENTKRNETVERETWLRCAVLAAVQGQTFKNNDVGRWCHRPLK